MVHNTVTDKKRAANRSNGAQSHGPSTEEGKERAKMNAFKHGHDAARPDAATLLGADLTEQEAAEREALREATRRSYVSSEPSESGPADGPDSFAAAEATELADLRYELVRLGRVRALARQREQELLELEERRRRVQRHSLLQATTDEVYWNGLLGLPDSPAKWRQVIQAFEVLAAEFADHQFDNSIISLQGLYGINKDSFEQQESKEDGIYRDVPTLAALWRGQQFWDLAEECRDLGEGAELDAALGRLQGRVAEEMEAAKAGLELAELELAPLTAVGQSAGLEEALASRRWSWIRQQENFLRREIDRKVRILLELRKQAARAGGGGSFDSAQDRRGSGVGEEAPGEVSVTPRRDGGGEKKSAKSRNEPTKTNKLNNATQTADGSGEQTAAPAEATTVPPDAAAEAAAAPAPEGSEGA